MLTILGEILRYDKRNVASAKCYYDSLGRHDSLNYQPWNVLPSVHHVVFPKWPLQLVSVNKAEVGSDIFNVPGVES